jgi:hypothetical protein
LGFDGPYSGAWHQFMTFGQHRLTVPSNEEFSVPQLHFMLQEVAEIVGRQFSADEWNDL